VHAGPRGLQDAGYIWLPLMMHESTIRIQKLTNWSLDRPLFTAKWENASKLHEMAMSEHANTIKSSGGSSIHSKRFSTSGSGESSWSLGEDPHANWCTKGQLLAEDSP
jgi:hypothetical protein